MEALRSPMVTLRPVALVSSSCTRGLNELALMRRGRIASTTTITTTMMPMVMRIFFMADLSFPFLKMQGPEAVQHYAAERRRRSNLGELEFRGGVFGTIDAASTPEVHNLEIFLDRRT